MIKSPPSIKNRPPQFLAAAAFALAALFAIPADKARDSVNYFLTTPHMVTVNVKDNDNWTAYDRATSNKMKSLLNQHGGNCSKNC